MFEADLLEEYNLQENMNIIGILEERNKMGIRRPKFEIYNKSLDTVLKVAREVAANECATSDILIAYRLPGRNTRSRNVIAGLSQRLAKMNFFARKERTEQVRDNKIGQIIRKFDSSLTTSF